MNVLDNQFLLTIKTMDSIDTTSVNNNGALYSRIDSDIAVESRTRLRRYYSLCVECVQQLPRSFQTIDLLKPFDVHCCHMGTAIKHPMPDRVKPSFEIFDIQAL